MRIRYDGVSGCVTRCGRAARSVAACGGDRVLPRGPVAANGSWRFRSGEAVTGRTDSGARSLELEPESGTESGTAPRK